MPSGVYKHKSKYGFLTGDWTNPALRSATKKKWRHLTGENKKYCERSDIKDKSNYFKEYDKKYPWRRVYRRVVTRCVYDKEHSYYKRGIKCLITINELKVIWFRDKAYLMKHPSIDRINTKENYELSNCRFLELDTNKRRERIRWKKKH